MSLAVLAVFPEKLEFEIVNVAVLDASVPFTVPFEKALFSNEQPEIEITPLAK